MMTMAARRAVEANEREQARHEGGADAHLIERFTRRETADQRRARIARKRVDPATAAALARLYAA